MLKYLAFLVLALVASAHTKPRSDESEELEWPSKYSFEITKYHIASGLVEDIKIWRTRKQSRVEYNQGAVKSLVIKKKARRSSTYSYEIHPETTSQGENKLVCHSTPLGRYDEGAYDILPNPEDFKDIGKEDMKDKKCTKFFKLESDSGIENKHTIWAFYDHEADAWVPVRYELKEYNTAMGNNDRNDIWEFESFNAEFDEAEVFSVDKACTTKESLREHHKNDEAVTKHLLFIDPENDHHVDHVFKHFKKEHNMKYAHKEEHEMRRSIFKRNLRLIKSTNRQNLSYKLAVNQFSDRTPEEMKRRMGLQRRAEGKIGTEPFPYKGKKLRKLLKDLPSVYDLRMEGVISPIQNQETCGSCWTFGTTSAIEGAIARDNGGQLMRLSNQALVDCAWEFNAAGCDGGTDNAAYEFVMKYGLPTIADYGTYQNQDGVCNIKNMTKTFKIRGFVDVTPNSIGALKVALVHNGPLSVSVHATDAFVAYKSGVFYDYQCNPSTLNHEITLVGYGEEYGETFWIVKNSWGPEWGIDGYMHILAKDNNCGIMTEPTYVVV